MFPYLGIPPRLLVVLALGDPDLVQLPNLLILIGLLCVYVFRLLILIKVILVLVDNIIVTLVDLENLSIIVLQILRNRVYFVLLLIE